MRGKTNKNKEQYDILKKSTLCQIEINRFVDGGKEKVGRWQSEDRIGMGKKKKWCGLVGVRGREKDYTRHHQIVATVGISQTMAEAADMSVHIW